MPEHNDFFTPEYVDEQIEQASRNTQPYPAPGTHLIHALEQDYQQEKEKDVTSLGHVWERLAAAESSQHLPHPDKNRGLIEIQQLKPGTVDRSLPPHSDRTPWQRISILVAVVVL